MATITLLHWPIGYESQWFQQLSLSSHGDEVQDAGIVSVSRAALRVVREQEQIRRDERVEAVVVLARWKKQLTGEQEGLGDGSDWAEDDVMTTTNLCWN